MIERFTIGGRYGIIIDNRIECLATLKRITAETADVISDGGMRMFCHVDMLIEEPFTVDRNGNVIR